MKIFFAHRIISAFFCILSFVAASFAATAEDFYDQGSPENGFKPVHSLQGSGDATENENHSLQRAEAAPSSNREDKDFAEQSLLKERERPWAEKTEEKEEPLIGENDLRENFDIPVVFNDAVEHYIRYFSTTKKKVFEKWLRRKKRYAPLMKEILREHDLPEDLVYLAMIESGFNLHAYSPMRAAGPWQFIPETGRRYGLVVNHWVDERKDIRKSTVAAARYLQDLFGQFGCWYLAAAGYNAGERRIDRLIKRYDTKDFWQLRAYNTLPRETREYVPQLIAAAVIAKEPERYGLGAIENITTFEFVKETVPGGVPLEAVAEAAATDLSSIRAFNPEIRRGITPPGRNYKIKLPVETDRHAFRSSLTSILNEGKRVVKVIRHLTGRRDNVRKIAKRYGVSREDLVLVNGRPLSLKRGRLVYIPRFLDAGEKEQHVAARKANFKKLGRKNLRSKKRLQNVSVHVVERGETLSVIAAKYGVKVRTLKRVNGLKSDRIQRGRRLSLVKCITKTSRSVSKKYHRVQKGDTLSGIAEKYGRSVGTLKNMNGLKNNRIQKGMRLRVSLSRTTFENPLIGTRSKT